MGADRHRFHLKVEASSDEEAIAMVRRVLEECGADTSSIEVHRSNLERDIAMAAALHQARTEITEEESG
jgi:hypothetical protein